MVPIGNGYIPSIRPVCPAPPSHREPDASDGRMRAAPKRDPDGIRDAPSWRSTHAVFPRAGGRTRVGTAEVLLPPVRGARHRAADSKPGRPGRDADRDPPAALFGSHPPAREA